MILDILRPRARDIGSFSVRRALPAASRPMVGPFIFFDHMGPETLAAGAGIDVRPHPHIGLATVTWLFDGALLHRDSLGSVQVIRPGDVNWMSAGHGIVHSERTPPDERARGGPIHGIQTWVALPKAQEESEPAFSHHPAATVPQVDLGGTQLAVIAGEAFAARSPVPVAWPTLYVAATLAPGGDMPLDTEHEERAVYCVEGRLEVDGTPLASGEMAVLAAGATVRVKAPERARAMLVGGARMDGPRFIWWNFVSSSRERIEAASIEWREDRFPQVPGETERIPLPER